MYRYLRNTHLLLGVFSCLFLLMYGISSVQMAHPTWFSLRPAVTSRQVALPPALTDARPLARELMDRYGLRGDLAQVRSAGGRLSFWITRPGTVYQVEYAAAGGQTTIRDNHAGFMGMLNRIHHVAGLNHEYALTNIWGGFVLVISIVLILMGLTGLYLWFQLHRERRIGAVLLALNLVYSITLLVLVRASW